VSPTSLPTLNSDRMVRYEPLDLPLPPERIEGGVLSEDEGQAYVEWMAQTEIIRSSYAAQFFDEIGAIEATDRGYPEALETLAIYCQSWWPHIVYSHTDPSVIPTRITSSLRWWSPAVVRLGYSLAHDLGFMVARYVRVSGHDPSWTLSRWDTGIVVPRGSPPILEFMPTLCADCSSEWAEPAVVAIGLL